MKKKILACLLILFPIFSLGLVKADTEKTKYVIASDSSFAPFVFQDSSNQYTGIDMDLIKAIAEDQGFEVEITNPGFDAAINAVQSGQADGIIAGMSVTDARKETFDFSDSYYTANTILGVKESSTISSYEDLNGKTVGVKNGTASQTFLNKNQSKYGYKIKTFSDAASMYDSLNTGSIDAVMDDEPVIKYSISQGQKLKTPIAGTPIGETAFAVKKGSNPELLEKFNKGLANLKANGEFQKILDKVPADKRPSVDIVPGLSAVNVAASVLGAPLMHDFAVISLSDLMTPWDLIKKRADLCAQGDMVISLYNPRSKKRVTHLDEVREIVLKYRDPKTPVGIVQKAGRPGQHMVISDLENFTKEEVDMQTLVIIGNSQTYVENGRMITPRGYKL